MLRVLWIVNITMPDACVAMGLPTPVVGGWLTGYQQALLQGHGQDVELHVLEPYDGHEPRHVLAGATTHHLFPQAMPTEELRTWMRQMHDTIRPDAVHIHGTELPHALTWFQAVGMQHTLVSIQGLVSVCAAYFMAGLSREERRRHWSFNDWRWHRTLAQQQQAMAHRGEGERQVLQATGHVAGRTSWDRAHALTLQPQVTYHTLQEVLRPTFYEAAATWRVGQCQRHSIFVSQSHYPIKGLHQLLAAMPHILRQYPDTQLYIVGQDETQHPWRHVSCYAAILRDRMQAFRAHVHYVGTLDAQQMADHYRRAHVFCCPSAIENSSNSVCEAQMVGTPTVAAYVGGMMDLITDGESGLLYRFEEAEMLAQKICQVFADDTLATHLSQGAARRALSRHDRQAVADTLYNIYKQL